MSDEERSHVSNTDGGGSDNDEARGFFLYAGQAPRDIPWDVTLVRVHPSVERIDGRAFRDCLQLAETVLHEGLKWIGAHAFQGCKSLKRIRVPSSVESIGVCAFDGCDRLEEVVLCEGLKQIGICAFQGCKSLSSVSVPTSVEKIAYCAFIDCDQLEEVRLGEGLEKIGGDSFRNCKSMGRIYIPSSVKVINRGAFNGCARLEEAMLCNGLEHIGDSAFISCTSLRRIDVPSSVKAIWPCAFRGCGRLEGVVLHEGLEEVGRAAFQSCKSLKHITMPFSVGVVANKSFSYCNQLEEVVLGKGLERIGGGAFTHCKSLTRISIPSSVKLIDKGVFSDCNQLMSIEMGDGVARLDKDAFQCCSSLRNVAIQPESQTVFGFEGCHDLLQLFGSQKEINCALKNRFVGLPIHELCYYQARCQIEATQVQLGNASGATPGQSEPLQSLSDITSGNQDCLGMTPLHLLACSTRQDIGIYRIIVSSYPESLVTEDKWGCLPIFYAIWGNAPLEITHFLVSSLKLVFPNVHLNWDKMIETLCRAGASVTVLQRLLGLYQASFNDNSIDWQKAAQEMAIRCLVISEFFADYSSIWEEMMESLNTSFTHHELNQSLLDVRQTLFPNPTNADWQFVCEEFARPLKSWWKPDRHRESLETFRFLAKCRIPERLAAIGVRKWRMNMKNMVERAPPMSNSNMLAHFDAILCKLVSYEHEYCQLKTTTFLLELALWKSKIEEVMSKLKSGEVKKNVAEMRAKCRINSGGGIIISNVLSYLIPSMSLMVGGDGNYN